MLHLRIPLFLYDICLLYWRYCRILYRHDVAYLYNVNVLYRAGFEENLWRLLFLFVCLFNCYSYVYFFLEKDQEIEWACFCNLWELMMFCTSHRRMKRETKNITSDHRSWDTRAILAIFFNYYLIKLGIDNILYVFGENYVKNFPTGRKLLVVSFDWKKNKTRLC